MFRDDGKRDQSTPSKPAQEGGKAVLQILRIIEAADLARRGNQIGSKHGCVICVPNEVISKNKNLLRIVEESDDLCFSPNKTSSSYDTVVGRGWNHNVVLLGKGRKRMIHSEVHAVADTIRIFGEMLAFEYLFPHAVVLIVELRGDTSYDDAPPCPKCEQLLRAVGICKACHTTDRGLIKDLRLPSPKADFFNSAVVRVPLRTVCDELGIDCSKLKEAEDKVV